MLMLVAGCDGVFGLERDDVVLACPASFREVAGSFYLRQDDPATWHAAESACEALRDHQLTGQIHLAVVESDVELAAIAADLSIDTYWLGHTNLAPPGTFVPVTPEVVDWPSSAMPPWAGGQPNNNGGNQHCLFVDGNGLLDDKSCTADSFRFVCECDRFPSTAPLPP
jgi:hypothetical protein